MLVDTYMNAGTFEAIWKGINKNGNVVSSGLYFVQIITSKINEKRKIVVIK